MEEEEEDNYGQVGGERGGLRWWMRWDLPPPAYAGHGAEIRQGVARCREAVVVLVFAFVITAEAEEVEEE